LIFVLWFFVSPRAIASFSFALRMAKGADGESVGRVKESRTVA
jgi:hypothetical protein